MPPDCPQVWTGADGVDAPALVALLAGNPPRDCPADEPPMLGIAMPMRAKSAFIEACIAAMPSFTACDVAAGPLLAAARALATIAAAGPVGPPFQP